MLQRVGAQRGTADAELLILAFEEEEISEEEREQALKDVKYDCVGAARSAWHADRERRVRLAHPHRTSTASTRFSASATRFASKFADRELWYRREGSRRQQPEDEAHLLGAVRDRLRRGVHALVIYFLYKAVRWALGRGGGAAPAAEAKGGKAKAKAQ